MLKFINRLNNSIKIGQIYVKTNAGCTPISSVYQVTNNGLQKLFGAAVEPDIPTPEPDIPTPDIPTHTHSWNTTWSKNDTKHWIECKGCEEIKNEGTHIPDRDSPTETLPVKCTVCGCTIQSAIGHKHNFVKTKIKEATCTDPAQYQNICSCGQVEGAPYTDGAALGHDFSGAWIVSQGGLSGSHWKRCVECNELGYYGSHTIPNSWQQHNEKQHKRVCPVCNNYTYAVEYEDHAWAYSDVGDDTYHLVKCLKCSFDKKQQPHNYGSWQYHNSTIHKKVCQNCGHTMYAPHYGGTMNHGYATCEGCNRSYEP